MLPRPNFDTALVDANVNHDGAARHSLAAFINAVETQRGKPICSGQADP